MGSLSQSLDLLMCALRGQDGKPKGWLDVHQLRVLWKMQTLSAASNKAKLVWQRGFLERRSYHLISEAGTHSLAFAYRPLKPLRTMQQVYEACANEGAEKPPAGWIGCAEFAAKYGVSVQAVHQMTYRHKVDKQRFRVKRGFNGLKNVIHYREAELRKLHKAKPLK
jgi:hypothetical protein